MNDTERSESPISDQVPRTLQGGRLAQAADSFFVLRPTLMFPLWTMILAGVGLSDESKKISSGEWVALVVSLSALFGLVYLLNQLKDRAGDAINAKLFLIASGKFSNRHLMIEIIVLILFGIGGLLLSHQWHVWFWILLGVVIGGVIYNFTPWALERNPAGGVIAGFVGGWLLIRLGGEIGGGGADFMEELPYALAFTSACLIAGLLDRRGDEVAGKRTFAVVFGEKVTIAVCLAGFLSVILFGGWNGDWLIIAPAALSLPVLFYGWWNEDVNKAVTANKIAIFILSFGVGFKFIPYLVVIVLYYPIARWYHRTRFGLRYPSLAE